MRKKYVAIFVLLLALGVLGLFWLTRDKQELQSERPAVTRLGEEGRVAVLEYHDFGRQGDFSITT